jgi:hypothetical protein
VAITVAIRNDGMSGEPIPTISLTDRYGRTASSLLTGDLKPGMVYPASTLWRITPGEYRLHIDGDSPETTANIAIVAP